MKYIIICDLHLNEKSIPECKNILDEIFSYKVDGFISGGDLFDKHNPSYTELIFASSFLPKIRRVVIGNHDRTNGISPLDIYSPFGIEVSEHVIIEDNNYRCLVAHFMTDATMNYDKVKVNLDENFKGFNHYVIGHEHVKTLIKGTEKKPIAIHPGSVRYISHSEEQQPCKFITEIDTIKQTLRLIPLKSPIPMKSFSTLEELKSIPKNTKVRYIINDWEAYKSEITEIGKLGLEYADFKIKWNVKEDVKEVVENEGDKIIKKMDVFLNERLSIIKDNEVKQLLSEQFKEIGLI